MKEINNFFSELKYDLPASLIVFLVALPLCLGIALASGAPLFSGIIAGIVGGTIVALVSGSPLGVSGPAAGLVVIVLGAIQSLGFEVFLLAVMISGLIQIILGYARAGIIGYYFPTAVIRGMLAAIGIIIFLKQIPHAFGYDQDYEGDLAFVQPDGQNTFSELLNMFNYLTPGAIIVSVLSLGILILWEQKFFKNLKFTQFIQGPLVVVVVGIVLNMVFQQFFPSLAITAQHLVSLPVAESLPDFLSKFTLPDFSGWNNPEVYVVAITLAAVASLETLLTVEATDKLDPYKRVTPTNLELKAQGLGNFLSGLIGGLPITQVIVRSSANIQSGGRTKASAFFHGLLLLLCVMLIPTVLNLIPLASLAAILILVGFKLAKPTIFKSMYARGWDQFIPFLVTILAILFTDLLVGIGIGMMVSIFFILRNNYKIPYYIHKEDLEKGHVTLKLSEDVSFLNKGSILKTLNQVRPGSTVVIDATDSINVDYDVQELLADFEQNAKHRDITIYLKGFEDKHIPNPFKEFHEIYVKNPNGKETELMA